MLNPFRTPFPNPVTPLQTQANKCMNAYRLALVGFGLAACATVASIINLVK